MTADSIADAFADAAARLTARADVAGSLVALLTDCVALLDGTSAGLLIEVPEDGLALLSSTSHTTDVLELYELQNGRGPCIQAIHDNQIVTAMAPGLTTQWDPVGRAITGAGHRAVHAFPLRWHDHAVGAINLFSASARGLDDSQQRLGQAFANMAVAVLAHPRVADWTDVNEHIFEVLADRATVEQAKGVLAVQSDIDLPQAYALLVATAAERQLPLSEYAAQVIAGTRSAT